mgnify:CR=1 FL=1
MIDEKAIEEHIRGILAALGDDPEREGLIDTPKRVAKMYTEILHVPRLGGFVSPFHFNACYFHNRANTGRIVFLSLI